MDADCGSYSASRLKGSRSGPEKRVVQPSGGHAIAILKHLLELPAIHAQIRLQDIGRRQTGIMGELLGDGLLARRIDRRAFLQRQGIIRDGEMLGFFQKGFKRRRVASAPRRL